MGENRVVPSAGRGGPRNIRVWASVAVYSLRRCTNRLCSSDPGNFELQNRDNESPFLLEQTVRRTIIVSLSCIYIMSVSVSLLVHVYEYSCVRESGERESD